MPTFSNKHGPRAQDALDLLRTKTWDKIDKPDLIPLIMSQIDQLMNGTICAAQPDTAPSELLFDILMTRFDVMAPFKQGIMSLCDHARKDPTIAFALYKATKINFNLCLLYAGLPPTNGNFDPRNALYAATYGHVLLRWGNDSTPDSSSTMATLHNTISLWKRIGVFVDT